MKNVLVFGGAGFVGHHLVMRLLATPGCDRVTVFDNLSSGNAANVSAPAKLITGNLRDFDAVRTVVRDVEPDTIFQLAANPDISRAVTEPTIDFEQGTVLTKNVLEAMRLNGCRRLIYFSGSGVYGDTTESTPEDYGPCLPISTYGASKLACEAMISSYCAMFGITARAFRFANIVGGRQTHGVGFDFLRRLKENPTELRILGDGHQQKSYIHIHDALAAVDHVIATTISLPDMRQYDVYNVATQDSITVTEIALMACLAMGLDPVMVKFHYTGGDRGWKGDVPMVALVCTKIHDLGWRCTMSSRDAMHLSLLAMREEIA